MGLCHGPRDAATVAGMEKDPASTRWDILLRRQKGAISRTQVVELGLNGAQIAAHLKSGRWQRPIPGIYVTFTGPLPPLTRYWVALLHAGTGALLSHITAGMLWQLIPEDDHKPVHLTVPRSRGTRSRTGLVIHRPESLPKAVGWPPRTNLCETVLALCGLARRPSEVTTLLGRVAQQYPDEFAEARQAGANRGNLRWRKEFLAVAQDVAGGAHSELERRYLVDVERAHGLPPGIRQRAVASTRQDVHYDKFATTVELDGRAVHQSSDASWRDMERDNGAAVRSEITLRYGWQDVRWRPCIVAAQVATVLRARGWRGHPKPCRPGCPVADVR